MLPPRFDIDLLPQNFTQIKHKNILILILIIQIVSTQLTNTKRFSIQAYIRNILIIYSIKFTFHTGNPFWLLIPIVFHLTYNMFLYITRIHIQPYITSSYLYSDFFEYFVKQNSAISYYTEGSFSKLLNINTLDTSANNVKHVMNYGENLYKLNSPINSIIECDKNNCLNPTKAMNLAQIEKFKWIVDNLNIKSGVRVLEIGFGKLDLMRYIHKTGADIVGINISTEQVKNAKKEGFEAFVISFADLNKISVQKMLGLYDVIITNGSFEYVVNLDSRNKKNEIYYNIAKNINKLLVKGGKWYTTTIHLYGDTFDYKKQNINTLLYNYIVGYPLLFGNEGGYPINRDGLSKNVVKAGFNIILQENRWLDYYLFSIIWSLIFKNILHNMPIKDKLIWYLRNVNLFIASPNFIESYLCYIPFRSYKYFPWLWQFIAQKNKNNFRAPTSHEWIIFQKK
tara:strand:- start:1347 stop:2708 length:1362 start_codon:yes stop_codon:yes gene_type:complete